MSQQQAYRISVGKLASRLQVSERELAAKFPTLGNSYTYMGADTPVPMMGERRAMGTSAPAAITPVPNGDATPDPPRREEPTRIGSDVGQDGNGLGLTGLRMGGPLRAPSGLGLQPPREPNSLAEDASAPLVRGSIPIPKSASNSQQRIESSTTAFGSYGTSVFGTPSNGNFSGRASSLPQQSKFRRIRSVEAVAVDDPESMRSLHISEQDPNSQRTFNADWDSNQHLIIVHDPDAAEGSRPEAAVADSQTVRQLAFTPQTGSGGMGSIAASLTTNSLAGSRPLGSTPPPDIPKGNTLQGDGDSFSAMNSMRNIPDSALPSALSGDDKRKKPKRSVHFSRDAIQHVELVQNEAQILMRVQYNRPVWSFFIGIVAYFAFAIAWSLIAELSFPSDKPGEDTKKSFLKFSFMCFTTATVAITFAFVLCFRCGRRDLINWKKTHYRWQFVTCVIAYGVSRAMFVGAMMYTISSATVANFCSLPVVFVFAYLCIVERKFQVLDLVGVLIVFAANIVLFVGEIEVNRPAPIPDRYIGAFVCIGASLVDAMYRVQMRKILPHFDSRVILTASLVCAAVLIFILTASGGGLTAITGRRTPHEGFMLDREEVGRVIIAAICMIITLAGQAVVSHFFDIISSAAGMCVCAPLVLMFFISFGLPTIGKFYSYLGFSMLIAGCGCIVLAGWIHRRRVEIPINVSLVT